MTNIEKYNNAFVEVFCVDTSVLNSSFSKNTVEEWDSVHQLNITALLEELFDILFDPEDIMALTSYDKGIEILKKYQVGETQSCENIKNAGALIGNLERVLTIIFVIIGQYEAIGFIIAAKSILRFKDTDTAKTEYVLAGTFLSFGIALLCGLMATK